MTRINHILCPIDFSDCSRHALEEAAALARFHDARLTVFHVVVDRPGLDGLPIALDDRQRNRLLEAMRTFAAVTAPGTVDYRLRQSSSAADAILGCIEDVDPDLLVLGTHGRSGVRHALLGSVAERVLRRSLCPSLVVPPRAEGTTVGWHEIVCPIDFSPSSLAALACAHDLAERASARLLLLHVIDLPPVVPDLPPSPDFGAVAARLEDEARRRLDGLIPETARDWCRVETSVVAGHAAREIVRVANERRADLIVIGVPGRNPVDLLLSGSTTHRVLRAAGCPVLIVRSRDAATAWRRYREEREAEASTQAVHQ